MQSKGSAPSAEQKQWRESLREIGCINHIGTPAEIHHVVGATGRQNKLHIGHWFILPLCSDCHRLNPAYNVTSYRGRFTALYGTQVELFDLVCEHYQNMTGESLPFDDDTLNAIRSTRR